MQARDLWAALQTNCFEEDDPTSKQSGPLVCDLPTRGDRGLTDARSRAHQDRYASVSTDYADDNDECTGDGDDGGRYREERDISQQESSLSRADNDLGILRSSELIRNFRPTDPLNDAAVVNGIPATFDANIQREHRDSHRVFAKDSSKETPYLGIFDPFQKFDDFYAIGPTSGIPAADLAQAMGSGRPWTYDYFQSDGAQKSYVAAQPCSTLNMERFKVHEAPASNNPNNLIIDGTSPRRYDQLQYCPI